MRAGVRARRVFGLNNTYSGIAGELAVATALLRSPDEFLHGFDV